MASLLSVPKWLMAFGLAATPWAIHGQSAYSPQGGEFRISGPLIGDQMASDISLNSDGGYLVWQDNSTDESGLGIRARRVASNLGVGWEPFRVNSIGQGDQESPSVAVFQDGGAAFAWQGGALGSQKVFIRFMSADGTFSAPERELSASVSVPQSKPKLATISAGALVAVWSTYGGDGNMQGVFGRRFAEGGRTIGGEFQVNQTTFYNQRDPAVAGLDNGNFVVAWASEQQRMLNTVDVYARLYNQQGEPLTGEILVDQGTNVCANPSVVGTGAGGFMVGWSERDMTVPGDRWDVRLRTFNASGEALQPPFQINTHAQGDHFAPQMAAMGTDQLVIWTSSIQDGFANGIFGRFVSGGQPLSGEFQVNTYAGDDQMHPTVAASAPTGFLAVWSSFVGGSTSFDLLAQRYGVAPVRPAAPFVSEIGRAHV